MEAIDPQTRKPIQVADDQAADLYAAGKIGFRKGQRIPVKGDDGTIGSIAATDLSQALSEGIELATPEEFHGADVQAKYGDAGGMLKAAGAGAVRGLTMGLSDPLAIGAAGAFGGDAAAKQTRETLAGLKEANPYASGGAELAGTIAPLLFTGGASGGVAAGVKAAGALPRATMGLGRLAEGFASKAVGEGATSLLGRIAQKAVPMAASGAAEGAAYGAGQSVSESALQDHELTAESLLASMGHGALIGGTLGGAMGGVGGALGHASSKVGGVLKGLRGADIDAVAERALGEEAAPGLGDSVVSFLKKANSDKDELIGQFKTSKARQEAVFGAEDKLDRATRQFREHADEVLKNTEALTAEAQGELKLDHIKSSVQTGNEKQTQSAVARQFFDINQRVDAMLADPGAYGQIADLKKAKLVLDSSAQKIGAAVRSGEDVNAKLFAQLDYVKRRIGKWSKPGQFVGADQATAQEMRDMYEGLRTGLEDEGLWGKAATNQREINQLWSRQLGTQDLFMQKVATKVGRHPDNPWMDQYLVDPAKAETYIKGLTAPKNDLTHSLIKDHIKNSVELADAIAKNFELPAGKMAAVERAKSAAREFEKTVTGAESSITRINQYKRLLELDKHDALGGFAGAVGGSLLGPLGAMAGLAANAMMRPGQAISQIAHLERATARMGSKLDDALGSFFKAGSSAASTTSRVAPIASVELSGAGRSSRDEYERQIKLLGEVRASPQVAASRIGSAMGDLGNHAPKTAAAFASTTLRATQFLASKAPGGQMAFDSITPQFEKPRVSDAEMAKFLRYAAVVNNPVTALEDMKHGRLTREGAEALKVVYPKLFSAVQAKTTAHLAGLKAPLPYQKKVQLATLLGVPADKSLAPKFIANMQNTFAQKQQQPKAPHIGGQHNQAMLTTSQRVEMK